MMSGSSQQQQSTAEEQQELARKHAAAVATSRQWSSQTESRIVRVSRVFGGKDRHSKVKTVKGLRDRRVRLSVPTAIQLYDLQDRLGLNQPSKVVDWLLNAARHEIDKLPPLQFPPHQVDLMDHMMTSSSMPLMPHVDDKFCHFAAAAGEGVKAGADEMARFGYHRFMGLNSNSLGLVNGGMPYNFTGAESWNNSSVQESGGGAGSPQAVSIAAAAHHSTFPSLLSLAPRSHQLVYYSSEADQFPVNDLGSQSLSLNSARAFHDQTES
uniref:Uncharacterized protein n=1 Tax=Avena sativa TaxID=4498 RepID=A0ACD5VSW0_AVESA